MNLKEAKIEVAECLNSKDIENIRDILQFNDLGDRLMKILHYIQELNDNSIENCKDKVAKYNGYPSNILGTSWEYAMISTHRTKKQIELYEQLVTMIANKS